MTYMCSTGTSAHREKGTCVTADSSMLICDTCTIFSSRPAGVVLFSTSEHATVRRLMCQVNEVRKERVRVGAVLHAKRGRYGRVDSLQ